MSEYVEHESNKEDMILIDRQGHSITDNKCENRWKPRPYNA